MISPSTETLVLLHKDLRNRIRADARAQGCSFSSIINKMLQECYHRRSVDKGDKRR